LQHLREILLMLRLRLLHRFELQMRNQMQVHKLPLLHKRLPLLHKLQQIKLQQIKRRLLLRLIKLVQMQPLLQKLRQMLQKLRQMLQKLRQMLLLLALRQMLLENQNQFPIRSMHFLWLQQKRKQMMLQ
jgi:hypothetical protein